MHKGTDGMGSSRNVHDMSITPPMKMHAISGGADVLTTWAARAIYHVTYT
jgi:hypothetical protein